MYAATNYEEAAGLFGQAALASPAPGTLQNLGNAEWQAGRTGPAILAWERAQWLNPLNSAPRKNLHFARKIRQLDAPELNWLELCSTWLPGNWWAWIASVSFWLAVALLLLPGTLRMRRAGWPQGLAAAAAFAVFLLTLPALVGVHTRSKLIVLLPRESPLRLTPTTDAQIISKLPAGESGWLVRERGKYVFIRTSAAAGWVERGQFGLVAGTN
jgi:tetratricopeptide (TPR) repeat protein